MRTTQQKAKHFELLAIQFATGSGWQLDLLSNTYTYQ